MHTMVENMATLVPGFVGVVSTAVSVPAAVAAPSAVAVPSAIAVTATGSVVHGNHWAVLGLVVVLEGTKVKAEVGKQVPGNEES